MKIFHRAVLGALLLIAAITAPALAEFHMVPVKWTHPGVTSSTNFGAVVLATHRGYVRDTTWIPMAASRVDTTAEFSLLDCDPIPSFATGHTSTTQDTTLLAYVVLTSDSTAASSVDWDQSTVAMQVNYGDRIGGWETAFTFHGSLDWVSGQKSVRVPIAAGVTTNTTDSFADYNASLANVAPRCRLIVTGSAAVAAPSARVFVMKWNATSIEKDAGNTSW